MLKLICQFGKYETEGEMLEALSTLVFVADNLLTRMLIIIKEDKSPAVKM